MDVPVGIVDGYFTAPCREPGKSAGGWRMDCSISHGINAGGQDADLGILGTGGKLGPTLYAVGYGRGVCTDP